MNTEAQIEALENLAQLDAAILVVELEIQGEAQALSQKREQLAVLDGRIEKARKTVEEMDRTRGELVQDARQMSVQMERSREKLARSRTEREVNAAQREVEELRKLYRDREIEVQKLTALVDQARQDMATHTTSRDELLAALGLSAGTVESKLGDLERQLGEKRAAREGLVKAVPPQIFRRYEMIRKRLGSALTHTEDGTCAVCHITLSPMMFQKLRRGDGFDQCPSCHRIIYFRAKVSVDSEVEPAANAAGIAEGAREDASGGTSSI